MAPADVFNGTLETVGAALMWANAYKLWRQKRIHGVYWWVQGFFALWGYWNLFYYPSLGQWVSFVGAAMMASGNTVWTALAIYYTYIKPRKQAGLRLTHGLTHGVAQEAEILGKRQ